MPEVARKKSLRLFLMSAQQRVARNCASRKAEAKESPRDISSQFSLGHPSKSSWTFPTIVSISLDKPTEKRLEYLS